MSDDQPPSGATPPGGKSRRRPPTIDLTATEIETTPVSSAAAEQPASAEEAPPSASVATEAAAAPPTLEPGTAPDVGLSPEASIAEPPRPETETAAAAASPAPETEAARPDAAAEHPKVAPRNLPPRGRVMFGVAAGALLVIALVAALAWWQLLEDRRALDARLTPIEQQLRELATRATPAAAGDTRALDDLRTRLAKLEATAANPRPAQLDAAVANRISAIEGEVKALIEQIEIAARRSDEAVATAREAKARADATAAALADLAQKLPTAPLAQKSELEALASRMAALERTAKTLEGEVAKRAAEGSDRTGRLAVAASALNAAVERGAPFASELATVKTLAADPKLLAPLEPFAAAGLPSTTALARELAALAPALQQAAGTSARDGGGILDRLAANAEKIIRVRPLDETPGSDAAAIVARVEFKAMHADIAGALAELAALPPAVRTPAEAWIGKAQARTAAIEASRKLVADALAGLSK